MATKNKTRYAILGVLSLSACTGYDIKKYCDNIISHFWNENFGHIYPVLKQLLVEGAIMKVEDIETSRKKTYEISDKGREEFLNWLMEPIEYQPARSEFLLKLSFSSNLPKENIMTMVKDYKQRHMLKIENYREMEDYLNKEEDTSQHTQKFYVLSPLRYGILASEAAIKWCDEVLETLQE